MFEKCLEHLDSINDAGIGLVPKSSQTLVTPWTIYSLPGNSSMGFPRQKYGSGLPFPSPEDLPNPGIEPTSPVWADGFFITQPPGKP